MVYFSLLSSKPGRGTLTLMGIKKAQTPSHTLYRAYHSPKYPMVETALRCAVPMDIWFCS